MAERDRIQDVYKRQIVGSDVTMYQGVTLGGTGKGHGKRHPTVCDGVFIGNNEMCIRDSFAAKG